MICDRALTSGPADERPSPVRNGGDPISETRHESEMDKEPDQPAYKAGRVERPDLSDRAEACDRRQRPFVEILDGQRRQSFEPAADRFRCVTARFHPDLRNPGGVTPPHDLADHQALRPGPPGTDRCG